MGSDPISTHTTQQTKMLRTYFQFLIAVTYIHEVQHCVSKYFYSSDSIAPMIVTSDEKGLREAGSAFERNYIGFLLQCEWDDQGEAVGPNRLWKLDRLIAKQWNIPGASAYTSVRLFHNNFNDFFLTSTVGKLLASLADNTLYEIDLNQETPIAGSPPSDGVRCWVQYPGAEGGEEEVAAKEDCTVGAGLVWRDGNGDSILLSLCIV
ncbi:hypothetical protein C8R47DRAFT_60124 [Mycena vitilis]|nr:hypothetical protein C8R47DRAFT_60124 [Mycena vitilis]